MRDWQKIEEVGGSLAFRMMGFLLKVIPHFLLVLIAYPVSLFYYLSSSKARHSVKHYLYLIGKVNGRKYYTYPLFLSFSITLIEKGEGWCGKIKLGDLHFCDDDLDEFNGRLKRGEGCIALVSHVGSSEELRSLAVLLQERFVKHPIPITCIVDFNITEGFNAMIAKLNPESQLNLMSIDSITPESIIELQRTIDGGGLVVIAGDRSAERNIEMEFLGETAEFPFGAFYLSSLLSAPAYFVTCVRTKDFGFRRSYTVLVEKYRGEVENDSRSARRRYAYQAAEAYVRNLESIVVKHPYQWFNFFAFWKSEKAGDGGAA